MSNIENQADKQADTQAENPAEVRAGSTEQNKASGNKRQPQPERAALMRDHNFRWLLGGGAISMLGDQFTMMALPWLVLKLTGDALTMGLVIALMGVPRAIFILVGGALVDRHSPKTVLMLTKYVNGALLGLLAAMVMTNNVNIPLIYAMSLVIGLASAFSIPSGSAILPHTIAREHLQAANGMLMGIRQITSLAGPLMAGLLIGLGGDGGHAGGPADARGLGLAFGFDCFSFLFSAWTLAQVKPLHRPAPAAPQPMFAAIGAGLSMVWRDSALRTCFAYWAVVAFFVGGSFQVAMPVLANNSLGGATALGLVMGAHGVGTLLGMAASSVGGKLRIVNLGVTMLVIDFVAGCLLLPMGHLTATWQAASLMLVLGTLAGFMQVSVFTWMQRRVPPEMLGRAMSIFMFIFMGLAPMSAMLAGWLMQTISVAQLFEGSAGLLILFAVLAFLFTPMRTLEDNAKTEVA